MFQESIYPVNDNQQQRPSLPPSRFQRRRSQRQRLRRQDPSPSSPESSSPVSVPAIVPTPPTVTLSVGVSAPPPTSSEAPTTAAESPTPSSSYSQPNTSSESPSDPLSSLPSSSESPSTSSFEYSTPTFTPPSTTTQSPYTPPYTPPYERSPPPMSSQTSSSSDPTITDTPPSPPPSSSSSSPTMSSSSSVTSPSVTPPSSSSSSSSGMRESTSDTPTTPPPSSSLSTSISTSISLSLPDGGPDDVTTTPTTTPTPPSSSSSSSSGDNSSSSSSSTGPSSPDRPGESTSSTRPRTDRPDPTAPMQNDGSSPSPMTTLSEPVTFTTTDASGSTILTVPTQFTTVIVTTLPGGTFTTVTEVVANPPGVLNQGDANRDSVAAFFQNKGAVAGVFIAASLAICAIVLFVIFALRRRRYRVRFERDAEIAAGLAAAASNQRFADDEDHPVVMRNVPSAMRGRSPWLDDDDDVYNTSAGPVMYSNYNGVGPPTNNMPITSEIAYPLTAARYTHARSNSGSPSPKKDLMGLPTTSFEPASPTGNSGWSSHGGGAYLGRDSVSPAPTTSAPASAYHGTVTHATSAGHAPSSYGGHRPPASAGKDGSGSGNGTGSGSGGTSQPSLMTATAPPHRAGSPKLEEMYPPEYEQFSRPASSAAVMGYAYEPDPVPHEHQIITDLRSVQGAYDGIRSPLSGDIAAMSVGSRSMYSHDGEGSREWDDEGREDSRLDPVMRMTGGLASAASVGPRDHEDYTRRVVPQQLASPSTGSHSYSLGHSHSTH